MIFPASLGHGGVRGLFPAWGTCQCEETIWEPGNCNITECNPVSFSSQICAGTHIKTLHIQYRLTLKAPKVKWQFSLSWAGFDRLSVCPCPLSFSLMLCHGTESFAKKACIIRLNINTGLLLPNCAPIAEQGVWVTAITDTVWPPGYLLVITLRRCTIW